MNSQWITRNWYSKRVNWLWLPFSFLFYCLVLLRIWLYQCGLLKRYSLPVPVVVIGNLTVGGTGKTPCVIALCQWLREQGFHPGVISRGYQGQVKEAYLIQEGDGASLVGDEPLLIFNEAKIPVAVGRDRYRAGTLLLQAHPHINIILSDDGLQHYRLQRDLEIVLIDGERQLGNHCLLPAGPLREPIGRLNSVDAIIFNGGDNHQAIGHQPQYMMELIPDKWINVSNPTLIEESGFFNGQTCHVTCAIGNPQRFIKTINSLNIVVKQTRIFDDHHPYQKVDFQGWENEKILMTEKDGIKCKTFAPSNAWMLKVHARFDYPFYQWFENKLRQLRVKYGS
ncbi:MAG: tetraacyldisaccharide 4'-kinase [Betaproteobacteria bacterium]|nr:tetraacyldisaccharide 4'-kinase [Betaproteobacteria bacterium]MDE2423734.1 tetraacyldisaccharide 4'-kinase [Betaproteobacteria bacterium]